MVVVIVGSSSIFSLHVKRMNMKAHVVFFFSELGLELMAVKTFQNCLKWV